jgi:hypothetical protein
MKCFSNVMLGVVGVIGRSRNGSRKWRTRYQFVEYAKNRIREKWKQHDTFW